jgi:hypothetical protein
VSREIQNSAPEGFEEFQPTALSNHLHTSSSSRKLKAQSAEKNPAKNPNDPKNKSQNAA